MKSADEAIDELVAAWPEPTQELKDELRALLLTAKPSAAAAQENAA